SELDGQTYTVQYFERAVFEAHPQNRPPYDILLSQLGTFQWRRVHPSGDIWATLRARPLRVPTIAPGAVCPATGGTIVHAAYGPALGPGPFYPVGLGTSGDLDYTGAVFPGPWTGQKVLWVGSAQYTGPALLRGRQLDGPGEVRFGQGPDPVSEMQLSSATSVAGTGGWRDWPGYTRVRGPGCYGYQVDGTDFSTIIVFAAHGSPVP
ncbi:MAG TPA: hypothetical protein VM536_14705, partial [Chloroflexia bacterium]|nr:hypothetical protein [Chloroflexia bacterium]